MVVKLLSYVDPLSCSSVTRTAITYLFTTVSLEAVISQDLIAHYVQILDSFYDYIVDWGFGEILLDDISILIQHDANGVKRVFRGLFMKVMGSEWLCGDQKALLQAQSLFASGVRLKLITLD